MAPFFFDDTAVSESGELPGEKGSRKPFHLTQLFKRHRRPLFWPAMGFLLGSTYPITRASFTSSANIFWVLPATVCAVFLASGIKPWKGARKNMFELKDSARSRMGIVFILVVTGYFVGTARGLMWTSRILDAQRLVDEVRVAGQFERFIFEVSGNPTSSRGFTTFIGELKGFVGERSIDAARNVTFVPSAAKCKDLAINVSLYGKLEVQVGDWIELKGKLKLPEQAKNPGEFDGRKHLLGKGVFLEFSGTVVAEKSISGVSVLSEEGFARKGFSLWGFRPIMGSISKYLERRFDAAVPEEGGLEERAVLKALYLGDKAGLSNKDSDSFRRTGLYRFITIAGFHVQFAASAVEHVFRRRVRNLHVSKIAALLTALFLGSLSGWAVGPLRVFLCLCLRQGAFYFRRKYDALNALAVCSLVIGWHMPFPLLNAAFQLSFSGMAAGWISGKYTEALMDELEIGVVRSYLLQSALMAAFLLPLLATHFQDVSVAGFLLGALWVPLAAATALSAFPLFFLPYGAARALGWLPFLVVKGLRSFSCVIAGVPGAALSLPAPRLHEVLVYLALLLALLHLRGRAEERACPYDFGRHDSRKPPGFAWEKVTALVLLSVLFALVWFRYYAPWPQVVFLSVGQGDSAVIRGRGGVILVDVGTESWAKRVLVPYLKHEGIGRVDLCIISHLHDDHVGGLGELCRSVKVKAIMTCPGSKESITRIASGTPPILSEKIVLIEAGAGDVFKVGSSRIRVIHPPKDSGTGRGFDNEDSLVLGLSYDGLPLFVEFWGDAPGNSIRSLLEGAVVETEGSSFYENPSQFPSYSKDVIPVVKVPHHGSPESLVDGFYERARGGIAVISVGSNSYGHPSPHVIEAAEICGVGVFRTDVHGAVTLKTYPGKVRVFGFVK